MNKKADNVIRIPTSFESGFFKYWLEFLRPFHKLTDREMDVLASLIKHRCLLSRVIKDDNVLDKVALSDDIKKKVREDCNIKFSHFQVIMSKLRRSGIINKDKINPKFIPNIKEENGIFQLLIFFELK